MAEADLRPPAGTQRCPAGHLPPFIRPLNRRLDQLRDRLPARLQGWLPSIPPATPRNLWLLLALLVATQSCSVFYTSQSANISVLALMIWGGALICIEDQLEDLLPRPGIIGLITGTVLLIWVLARTAIILHWDGMIFALAPLAGLALTLLCLPLTHLSRFRDPLLCLMLLPAFALLMRVLPEEPLSLITAQGAGFWLSILGLDVVVNGRSVSLPGGGVQVLAECNGLDMMAQILCVGLIFMLAFRIRSLPSRLLLFAAAPVIGLICNTLRIALLSAVAGMGQGKGTPLFTFFHDDTGSLVFSGVAVFAYGVLYMNLLERELPPLESGADTASQP
ncbi:exosortase/archaeosortase family protein [Synechococcus sp. CBW1004]|uniref:exosortase/archaeosortase family protein n=1 Tax=Synechococcus sp. CBW1004 TaxID=1353136 RepID=UPI0018CD9958|nr:exosortase/archaeosortase family protein [Synechococcus sp. CBW1004]QPN64286.1 exosortase/archaeosortase family protein [Synechococcus sp. CBW1004]